MFRTTFKAFAVIGGLLAAMPGPARAAESITIPDHRFSFDGIFGT